MAAPTTWQFKEGVTPDAGSFVPAPKSSGELEQISGRPTTYWSDAVRRIRRNKLAVVGFWIIIALFVIAIFGPMVSPYSYEDQDLENTFLIGVTYGGIAAYFGGRVDDIMMRIVDILYGIPTLIIVILLTVLFKDKGVSPLVNVFIAIGLTYWLPMARIVRGEILSLKEREFALAAKTIGAPNNRILFKHLIPNAMGPIIVTVTLEVPSAIFTEAFLSYIGLGVSAPVASWGVLASDGTEAIRSFPYLVLFPALAICLTMFAFNFLGDGLRDALDPRLRQ
jgi:oligopeptide transport system permease protein